MYIWELNDWPRFRWHNLPFSHIEKSFYHELGKLLGRMEGLGFELKRDANLRILTQEVVKSSEIEGEVYNDLSVRSSIGKRLGMDVGGLPSSNRSIDGIVDVILDATTHFNDPLTKERLCKWHRSLFPTGKSGLISIQTGAWRRAEKDPMQVISGPTGRETIHFEAPPSHNLDSEIDRFVDWFNSDQIEAGPVKAALAHLWFVTIHPFEDGNGRIGRAIMEMVHAQFEKSSLRFFSLSNQIEKERDEYYAVLKQTQSGTLDVSSYLEWYVSCGIRAIESSKEILAGILTRAIFGDRYASEDLNDRQISMLNKLLDGIDGVLSSSKWAKMTKVSQDTANRDIKDLMDRGILVQDPGGGRSTRYSLADV
ncbi:Fic family protein [bacterium]|nr:Fic family protein [bacterium]